MAAWWETTKPVFLDPVLVDRCAYGLNPETVDLTARDANAAVLVSVARYIGTALADDLSQAAVRTLSPHQPPRNWRPETPRSDMPVDWWARDGGLGLRVWVNHNGVSIGLRPGTARTGWVEEVKPVVSAAELPGFRLLAGGWATYGEDVGHTSGMAGEFTYAKWYEPEQLSGLGVREAARGVAASLQPLLDRLVQLASGAPAVPGDDPLIPLVEEFRARGYPTPADDENRADRERFAAVLDADNVALADPAELRQIWTTVRYGSPGPQATLSTSLRDADPAEYDRIVDTIKFLCWGDGDDADRIDAVLGDDRYRVRGLAETVIMKLLAICHPGRYVTVYPYSGPSGKRRMLQAMDIAEPQSASRGQLQVRSNDLLRDRLDAFFPGDPWGIGSFLYWYVERDDEVDVVVDPLEELATELLVDRIVLDDIVSLLQDKGQVILYGPPGTGKTYLARKLAEALVPDPTRRSLVQFHPSTSYEDFFEGYRPETDAAGAMTYRLTPGPLAMIAERARNAPGKRHLMVIDEINRANLPKVLGELLFLFEYRDESVRTLYRPEDAFELPKDLWFIGTMNTADRSIALIDAALRRRFHFIPFFPDHGPMQGLLDRWLDANGEPGWVGELVSMVNDELTRELGGPHLQLGSSHFMKRDLDEERLRRIWQYDIEPFVEDQFFGDPAQIEYFRFPNVLGRYQSTIEEAAVDEPGP